MGFGVFMGIVPIWGYQLLVGVSLAHLLKLNKALFIVAANISLPPLIPFIIYGSYKLGGKLVENPKNDLLFTNGITLDLITENFWQYAVGAVVLALIAGITVGLFSYILLKVKKKPVKKPA